MADFDLIIIGGGPGGYTGAIRAAQLGQKVAVVEMRETLGGTCLNVGCIPSKALLDSSEHYHDAQHSFKNHGIVLDQIKLDLAAMMMRKNKIVSDLTKGVAFLFKKNKIEWIQGKGRISAAGKVDVTSRDGSVKSYTCKNIMLATGSDIATLPGTECDGKIIVNSDHAIAFDKVPEHLVVVGGGVIGLELGSVWARLGAKVSVIEFMPKIAGAMDDELCKNLLKVLKSQGMEFHLDTAVKNVTLAGGKAIVAAQAKNINKEIAIEADKVLICIGRRPYSEGLGLEEVGVKKNERGYVVVDDHLQTNVPGIYAVGDLVPGPMLAHKAEEEGVAVAETIAGGKGHVNYNTVPGVVYTWPELASVGKTEEELKAAGIAYNSGKFPFMANGRAKALACTDGFVKILADKTTDKVLGVHILGPRASDMIAEAAVAMEFSASSEDIARAFHAHPTLAEVMREAALAVTKRARQM